MCGSLQSSTSLCLSSLRCNFLIPQSCGIPIREWLAQEIKTLIMINNRCHRERSSAFSNQYDPRLLLFLLLMLLLVHADTSQNETQKCVYSDKLILQVCQCTASRKTLRRLECARESKWYEGAIWSIKISWSKIKQSASLRALFPAEITYCHEYGKRLK